MQLLRLLAIITIFTTGCRQTRQPGQVSPVAAPPSAPPPPPQLTAVRSFPAQLYQPGAVSTHILFNSMQSFAAGTGTGGAGFITECMVCQPVEVYKDHLLFARQLEIYYDSTVYHPQPLQTSKPLQQLALFTCSPQDGQQQFRFSRGKGQIRYLKPACTDSELYSMVLHYATGPVELKRLVNAAFFEYDLNGDGSKEQYILSMYNCTQELTVLQLRPAVSSPLTTM